MVQILSSNIDKLYVSSKWMHIFFCSFKWICWRVNITFRWSGNQQVIQLYIHNIYFMNISSYVWFFDHQLRFGGRAIVITCHVYMFVSPLDITALTNERLQQGLPNQQYSMVEWSRTLALKINDCNLLLSRLLKI